MHVGINGLKSRILKFENTVTAKLDQMSESLDKIVNKVVDRPFADDSFSNAGRQPHEITQYRSNETLQISLTESDAEASIVRQLRQLLDDQKRSTSDLTTDLKCVCNVDLQGEGLGKCLPECSPQAE